MIRYNKVITYNEILSNLNHIQANYPISMIDRQTAYLEWQWEREAKMKLQTKILLNLKLDAKGARAYKKKLDRDISKKHAELDRLEGAIRNAQMAIEDLKCKQHGIMKLYETQYRIFEKWMPWMENEVAIAKYKEGQAARNNPMVVEP